MEKVSLPVSCPVRGNPIVDEHNVIMAHSSGQAVPLD
jgi:hypothetical protein